MKKIILIIGLLMSLSGFSQHGNFMFNQHTDGCKYGDLDDFEYETLHYVFIYDNCDDIYLYSVADAETALDQYRDASCDYTVSITWECAIKNISVNNYILNVDSNDNPECELFSSIDINNCAIVGDDFSLGNAIIISISDGKITSVYYY